MKTRSGVPTKQAFGPAKAPGTTWRLVRRDTGEVCLSSGASAFEAAQRRGWAMGELADIRVVEKELDKVKDA